MVRHWFWKGVWLTAALMGHVWLLMASVAIAVGIVNGGWLLWVVGAGDNKW